MLHILKSISLFILFPIAFLLGSAYQKAFQFEPYEQEIPGTDLSFGMVPIPQGTFIMGSKGAEEDETPAHEVTLDPFWMASHEVTWDLFRIIFG
jgi:formylglycine-generating enzyme